MNEYLVIDNWYSEEEKNNVLKELDFLSTLETVRTEEGYGTAKKDGKFLSKSFRMFPQQLYSQRGFDNSPMFKALKKMQHKDFHQKVTKTFENTNTALDKIFIDTNVTSTIVNYYENNDSYEEHHDVFQFTVLIWLYKEPKSFVGGDLVFTRLNKTVECKNNRLVLFPCFYYHAVNPVIMKEDKSGYGRYAITHFYYRTEF